MQLTEAEASFRALKSELSIRPLFHQLEPRVKAHVMVAFLGYALWVTLKHLLKRRPALAPKPSASGVENAQPMTPMRAIALLSTLQSADIVLPTTDGREIRLRRITEPTADQIQTVPLFAEGLIKLGDLNRTLKWLPRRRGDSEINIATWHRWAMEKRAGRPRLDTVRVGGTLCTSEAAV